MSTEAHNRMVWDGRTGGRIETWQLGFTDRLARTGYLIEYGLRVPLSAGDGPGGPVARVRFARFDADNPRANIALDREVPLSSGKIERYGAEPWQIDLDVATFGHEALAGEIASEQHVARWDLGFNAALEPHHYLPAGTRGTPLIGRQPMTIVAPNPAVHVTGRIEVDGRPTEIAGEPGCQRHGWGEGHLPAWALGYCNAFREDTTAALQVLSWRAGEGVLLGALPPVTTVAVYLGGEVYDFSALPRLLLSRGRWEADRLRFRASGRRVKLEGEIRARPEDFFRADLQDPDGGRHYCHVTEVADAVVTIWTRRSRLSRFRQLCRLTSRSAAHLEHGGRTAAAGIDRRFELVQPR